MEYGVDKKIIADLMPCIKPAISYQEITYFFLCLFFLKRFLRLCVAILCLFLFFPFGIVIKI